MLALQFGSIILILVPKRWQTFPQALIYKHYLNIYRKISEAKGPPQ